MGGGRTHMADSIDPGVGFISHAKIGDHVSGKEALGTLYFHDEAKGLNAAEIIRAGYEIADKPPAQLPALIKEVITA
jgi:thymidine phosphorylase